MLEAHHVTSAGGKKKTRFSLPAAYEGEVHQGALYHAVRAYLSNQRQGTHSTKTRAEVSGGGKKPWRQKGTGRARAGTTRAAQWRGGGVVFGPKPRSYRVDLPRKVKRLAKQSALNARAQDGALYVIESMTFESPKTRQVVDILTKLGIQDKKVLLLTAEHRPEVFLSSRNLPRVHAVRYVNASAYEILWADALVIEEAAFAIHQEERAPVPNARAKRVQQAMEIASRAQARTKKVSTDA
ncbi:MAG: 50S ribosomal protein L4 [Gemmatimonadetes bacterium]|nr:50S ribosomal protein L4 [Gemmatimonadota bacterium]MCH8254988.1 50S ribosomal protein L4 [Gemmatimonadota bacterium]MCH8934502.1 50S ribosomal protein L4 [Gemmatimonadota bacterium]